MTHHRPAMNRTIKWVPKRRPKADYGFHVSSGGLSFLAGMLLIGLVAVNADVNLLVVILGLGFGALVVSAFFNWVSLRGIDVERVAPEVVVAGQPFVVRLSVTNRKRWGRSRGLHIVDALSRESPMAPPEAYIRVLRPRETRTIEIPAVCPVRGRIQFGTIAVGTRFPFGLFTKYLLIHRPDEVVVFPRLGRLNADLQNAIRTLDEGHLEGTASQQAGDDEFYGIREFREGDNPRRIHWRRSARTGQLMIREMARSRATQIWCVVDTRVAQDDAAAAARLEAAISCAATTICHGLDRGARIGLICNGEPLVVMPPGGGRSHGPRLLRQLAVREPNHDDLLAPHIERRPWPVRWRGPCLLFAATETDSTIEAARALGRRIGPVSLYVPGSAAFAALFENQAGQDAERAGRVVRDAELSGAA